MEKRALEVVPGTYLLYQLPHRDMFADDNMLSKGQEVAAYIDPGSAKMLELRKSLTDPRQVKKLNLMRPINMNDDEWRARCDLAGLYRICDMYGWSDSIHTHMSVRVPGQPERFLINSFGHLFEEVTATSLLKVDLLGRVQSDEKHALNAAGFTIHAGVYRARPDVNCVMHTHTRAGTAISVLRSGLRPISQDALHVYDEMAYHEFGQPSEEEEGLALGESCKKGSSIVLRNHGLLSVGVNIASALRRMYMLNRACEIEILARSMGDVASVITPSVADEYARRMGQLRASPEYGMPEWHAAMRQIVGRGTDWRG